MRLRHSKLGNYCLDRCSLNLQIKEQRKVTSIHPFSLLASIENLALRKKTLYLSTQIDFRINTSCLRTPTACNREELSTQYFECYFFSV